MTTETAPMHGGDNAPPWMRWYRATTETPNPVDGNHETQPDRALADHTTTNEETPR